MLLVLPDKFCEVRIFKLKFFPFIQGFKSPWFMNISNSYNISNNISNISNNNRNSCKFVNLNKMLKQNFIFRHL